MRRLAVAAVFGLCLAVLGGPAFAQGANLPWGQSSDNAAWQSFVQVTAPSGIPNNRYVEFETWASDDDLYKSPTATPTWPAPGAPKVLHASVLRTELAPHPLVIAAGGCSMKVGDRAAGKFPANACIGEEIRRNWAAFQYIVNNSLYSRAGLAAASKAHFVVDMPADSVEVKADWVKVTDLLAWLKAVGVTSVKTVAQVEALYHTNMVAESTGTVEYAMVSAHLTTKQMKNWVWATFEHELNPGRCDDLGCHDSFGAVVANVAPRNSRGAGGVDINGNQQYGACVKSPALQAILAQAGTGLIWQHYCLKGSQITFVKANGAPVLLGDSVIERINGGLPVLNSSCITCHAVAAFHANGTPSALSAPVGAFSPSMIKGMTQYDFDWGITQLTQ